MPDPNAWVAPAKALLGTPRDTALSQPDIQAVVDRFFGPGPAAGAFVDLFTVNNPDHATRVRLLTDFFVTLSDPAWMFSLLSYQPAEAVAAFAPEAAVFRSWTTLVEIYHAMGQVVSSGRMQNVGQREQRSATPYLARSCWLLLSLPFWAVTRDQLTAEDLNECGGLDAIELEARQAREDWLAQLDEMDDSPYFGEDVNPVGEAISLSALAVNETAAPAGSTGRPPRNQPDAADLAVWRRCLDEHLLPRFAFWPAVSVAWRMMSGTARILSVTAAVLLGPAVATAFAFPGTIGRIDRPTEASLAAIVGYGAMVAAVVTSPMAARPWLLRQPASSVVGLLALATLTTSWWSRDPAENLNDTWIAAVGLAAAGVAYLVIEARNHGVGGWRQYAGRLGPVVALGLAHGFLTSLIAMRWLVPVVADTAGTSSSSGSGGSLVGWWARGPHPYVVPTALLLGFATAWSFASGVFAQILWDERPVTAPLAHISWRRGRD